MKPYFDFGFFTLLLVHAPGSKTAWELIRGFTAPYEINYLHLLQIQNLFVRGELEGNQKQKTIAAGGSRLWRRYFAEAVFVLEEVDFSPAFRIGLDLNAAAVAPVPTPALLLHPALAASGGATHFLSFDPRSRALAHSLRVPVLPHHL